MYNLPHFKAADNKDIIAFMHEHPFINLCGCDKNNAPVATHVPVMMEERDNKIYLQAHIMRKQKHTLAFEHNPNVLAIFSGAHSYVSASWYQKKNIGSTWNYRAVHAKGMISFKGDSFLHGLLRKLTAHFENNENSPALVHKMDESYVRDLMKSIVGFEVEITDIEHVFKLSQNRDEKSYDSIIQHLQQGDGDAQTIAAAMKENQKNVFPE